MIINTVLFLGTLLALVQKILTEDHGSLSANMTQANGGNFRSA